MDGSMGTLKSAHMRCTAPLEGRISTNLRRVTQSNNDARSDCKRKGSMYLKQTTIAGCRMPAVIEAYSEQHGQVKPAMLVTTPRTGMLTFSQKVSSFMTSLTATS